eukprot:7702426-Pyramimonas_sp.AAC.1
MELSGTRGKMKVQIFHAGRLFAIIVETSAEFLDGHRGRKFNGHVVLEGSDVVDQGGRRVISGAFILPCHRAG